MSMNQKIHINSCTMKHTQRINYICHSNEDEPSRPYYQDRYHTTTPNPPNQHPAYQHLRHFNEDEPSRPYYQERYHTLHTPPPNPPNEHPAYQHLCHINEDEPSRPYYQERSSHAHPRTSPTNTPNQHPAYQHLRHFNEDEPSRPYYQERSHTPHMPPETAPTNTQRIKTYVICHFNEDEPSSSVLGRTLSQPPPPPHHPETPPTNTQCYQHLCHFMKMDHSGLGRTSPCHKNHMNHMFMQHSMIVVDTCTKYKNMQIIRGPESRVTKNMPFSVQSVQFVLRFL